MNENLEFWNGWKSVPKEAQKPILGGDGKGMTDINPVWRIKVLTERFGPFGIGWYYEITSRRSETLDGTTLAFVDMNLYYAVGENEDGTVRWSMPVPGSGGCSLSYKTSGGYFKTDDNAYKKATTDAFSVCCRALGIGADVYWAKGANFETKWEPVKEPQPPEETADKKKLTERRTRQKQLMKETNTSSADMAALVKKLKENGTIVNKDTPEMTDEEFETMHEELKKNL